MTLDRWMLHPRARGVKAHWNPDKTKCFVVLAYAARETAAEADTFFAHGEGTGVEQACERALETARSDPFGLGTGL
jgi:hypothetical protein